MHFWSDAYKLSHDLMIEAYIYIQVQHIIANRTTIQNIGAIKKYLIILSFKWNENWACVTESRMLRNSTLVMTCLRSILITEDVSLLYTLLHLCLVTLSRK